MRGPGVRLVKDTPFEVGWLPWPIRPPRPSLTIVVKATFTLPASGTCALADPQELPTGDLHHEDDVERSLRWGSDMAILKPRGEVHFVGSCHPPGGPVTSSRAGLRVGRVAKQVAVFGDRFYKGGLFGGVTDPEPFRSMPLVWERAFGGPGIGGNPIGRGLTALAGDAKKRVALPNLEDPAHLIGGKSERPAPACFAPVPPGWPVRMQMAGTYDAQWQRSRWPWMPADFSWAFFQGAPRDQQIDGYFAGDEEIELHHLVEGEPRVGCNLPGLVARSFLKPTGENTLREVALKLDTIAIDGDRKVVCCLFRGVTDVADDALSDIESLFVVHEPLAAERRDYSAWYDQVLAREAGEAAAFEPEPVPGAAPSAPPAEPAAPSRPTVVFDEDPDQRMSVMLDIEVEEPVYAADEVRPPPSLPEWDTSVTRVVDARTLFGAAAVDPLPPADERDSREAVLPGEPPPMAPLMPPPPPAEVPMEIAPPADDAELAAAILADEPEEEEPEEEKAATVFALKDEDEEEPDVDELRTVRAVKRISGFQEALEVRMRLQRVLFVKGSLAGEDFSNAVLSGMDLRNVDFRGAILRGADLAKAQLDGAKLDGAVLAGARLQRARLIRTSLKEADLTGARMERARFEDAVLDDAVLGEAALAGARFINSSLAGADLARTDLRKARFLKSKLDGADLSGARLDDAVFVQSSLVDASLEGKVSAARVRLAGCDLTKLRASEGGDFSEADLHASRLDGARFGDARLTGADLSFSTLAGADFTNARLERSALLGCNLRGARFDGATLEGARLDGSDLFGARMEATDLERASLRGTNLFGAELWRARVKDANLDLAALGGTKLQGGAVR
jgi:uncharacterized protein YjbI with pentapeptide repeats